MECISTAPDKVEARDWLEYMRQSLTQNITERSWYCIKVHRRTKCKKLDTVTVLVRSTLWPKSQRKLAQMWISQSTSF